MFGFVLVSKIRHNNRYATTLYFIPFLIPVVTIAIDMMGFKWGWDTQTSTDSQTNPNTVNCATPVRTRTCYKILLHNAPALHRPALTIMKYFVIGDNKNTHP